MVWGEFDNIVHELKFYNLITFEANKKDKTVTKINLITDLNELFNVLERLDPTAPKGDTNMGGVFT